MADVARLQEFTALLEFGLSNVFKDTLPTHDLSYKSWLAERQAQEWIEDELKVTGFGPMPMKTIGGPFTLDKPFIGSEKEHTLVPYGLAFTIEYEMMRWDLYKVFINITRKLARSGVDRKNILGWSILNNSLTTSDAVYQTYQSQTLCNTAHTLQRGGTIANRPAAATGLSYLGIQAGVTDFMNMVNEDGLYIQLEPEKLVCHTSKKWIGRTILGSDYRHDTANQELNTLKGDISGPVCSPYLSSTTAWWLLSSKSILKSEAGICFDIGDDLEFRRDYQISTWNRTFTMYGSFRPRIFTFYGVWGTAGT